MKESIDSKFRALQDKIRALIEEDAKENEKSKSALIRLNKRNLRRYHDAFSELFKQYDRDKKEKDRVINSIAGTADDGWHLEDGSSHSYFKTCYDLNFESSESLKF